jgi:hypothetical protein
MSQHHICPNCFKKYSRKSVFDRHVGICDIVNKSTGEIEELKENTLSLRQMDKIIRELVVKNAALEKKVIELSRWVDRKKNKLNIIEWLNENFVPRYQFSCWYQSIVINDDDIELLMSQPLEKCFFALFKKISEKGQNPFTCFSHKANVFYAYANGEEKWQKMTSSDLSQCMKKIHYQIMVYYHDWYNKNSAMIDKSEAQQLSYTKTLSKIMKAELNENCPVLSKIKNELFNYLNTDIKRIMEC